MRTLIILLFAAITLPLSAQNSRQDSFRAVVLYDLGGKFDTSFNQAAYTGAERFKAETGIDYKDFEPTSETQYEQALKRFARRGYDLIIGVGLGYAVAIRNVAPLYPERQFNTIDALVDLPNVRNVTFKEHEGSFLVGIAAGMASRSDRIGFIGGMEIPLIKRFETGFRQGLIYANADSQLITNYVGSTAAAWNDPIRAAELARNQYARGVDVIYHAAGPSGLGVIQAAKDTRNLAIGVDSNQNGIAPGSVLTSMLKRVDVAVYQALLDAYNRRWTPGHEILGLAEGGVDFAVDDNNRHLITAAMQSAIDTARAEILAGRLTVADIEGGNLGK